MVHEVEEPLSPARERLHAPIRTVFGRSGPGSVSEFRQLRTLVAGQDAGDNDVALQVEAEPLLRTHGKLPYLGSMIVTVPCAIAQSRPPLWTSMRTTAWVRPMVTIVA